LITGIIIATKELEKSTKCNLQITPLATKLLAINIEKENLLNISNVI
jgi:hypothetical protein